jgi:hypothetical protein
MFRTPMSLDKTQRTMTLLVSALLVVSFAVVVLVKAAVGLGVFGLLAVVLALAWAMSPTALVVEDGDLRIERRAWRAMRVPLAHVASAAPLSKLGPGTLRVFGVGGFFGSYGLFSNGELGRFRLYATHGGQAVLVRRTDGELPLVLTPDDVAGTIAAIEGRPLLGA